MRNALAWTVEGGFNLMASSQNPQQRVMPTLRMTDYGISKRLYVESLGFQVDWEHRFKPDFPVFAQVSRDGLAFF